MGHDITEEEEYHPKRDYSIIPLIALAITLLVVAFDSNTAVNQEDACTLFLFTER
jgi:hypothetical protein